MKGLELVTAAADAVSRYNFLWIVVVGAFAMIIMGFLMGANDVANSFGTSVGSRSLSLGTACLLAAACETFGSAVFGGFVAKSVQNGIIEYATYKGEEEVFMLGMLSTLFGAIVWVFCATSLALPVSTTHAVIGGILGFVTVTGRLSSVNWSTVWDVVLTWIFSPLITGVIAALFYCFMRHFIFRANNPIQEAYRLTWLLFLLISTGVTAVSVYRSTLPLKFTCKQLNKVGDIVSAYPCIIGAFARLHIGLSLLFVVLFAALVTALLTAVVYSYANYRLKLNENKYFTFFEVINGESNTMNTMEATQEMKVLKHVNSSALHRTPSAQTLVGLRYEEAQGGGVFPWGAFSRFLHTLNSLRCFAASTHSLGDGATEEGSTEDILDTPEVFDERIETFMAAVQITSACFASIAHGANDVSNAVGPYAAILFAYNEGGAGETMEIPLWMLLTGGLSMSLGLALLGYKVIETIGNKMIKMTASRGMCVEVSTGCVVFFFSNLGVPLSSTYCQVGALAGIGLVEPFMSNNDLNRLRFEDNSFSARLSRAFNFDLFARIFIAWIMTVLCAGVVSSLLCVIGLLFV